MHAELAAAGRPFEVVFVSSDRDEASFGEYFATMPWAALPFADRARKAALSSRFKVEGIPTLVLLDAAGEVITTDGREAVGSSGAAGFPWAPKTIGEALGCEPLVDASGKAVPVPAGRYVALYFRCEPRHRRRVVRSVLHACLTRAPPTAPLSASWCPPCRGFTPKLAAAYAAVNAAAGGDGDKALEVVFVSGDNDEAAFQEYHQKHHGPWPAVPYGDEARRDALNAAAGVRGIPALLLCERDAAAPGGLRVVNASARGAVEAGRAFPAGWLPPAVPDVNDSEEAVDALNAGPVLCLLADGAAEADSAAAVAALTAFKAAQAKAAQPLFACAVYDAGGVSRQLRSMCGLEQPAGVPQLLLVDCQRDEFWLFDPAPGAQAAAAPVCHGDVCTMPARAAPGGVDEAAVHGFVDAWRAGTLTKRAMRTGGGGEDDEGEDEGDDAE